MGLSNKVFEPIEAIVHFDNLKINVIKFKWKSEVYKVTEMLQSWEIPSGDNFSTHFVVKCAEQDVMCELSMRVKDKKWSWEIVQWDSLS